MRLEILQDNAPSIALFENMGYRRIGIHADYYEDHVDALRYEKMLAPHLRPDLVRAPYYQQTSEFTCGPAALLRAMHALDDKINLDRLQIPIHYNALSVDDLKLHFDKGEIPVVLISSYRMYGEKAPHWVVVTGFDDRFIYVHDPYVDEEKDMSQTACINIPIALKDFDRMARYGQTGQRAALIVRKSGRQRKKLPAQPPGAR